jgi:ubiquinone/menaquinone biosynthesis C-methylase UbiE
MVRADPYRLVAGIYDRIVEPMQRGVRRRAVDLIAPQSTWQVLDVGCGTGTGMVPYVEAGCTVVGVDVSEAMLDRARKRLGNTVELHLTDGDALPFEDGRFDLVNMSMVLHEIPAAERAGVLREMARVAAPSGRLLVTEFRFGTFRGAKGRVLRLLSWTIERISGHYNGYRSFRASNGVPGVVATAGLAIETEKVVAGGNVAIFVL